MNIAPKKKAIVLCVLFAVIYAVHGVGGSVWSICQLIQSGSPVSHGFLGWYHILTLALAAAVYLPLSTVINRLARQANMRVLKGISTFVMVVLSVFIVLNVISIIVWLINPNLVG